MPRKAGCLLAAAVCLVLFWQWAARARDTQRASELGAQADRLLEPGFEQAQTLAELRATDARSLAQEAHELVPSADNALRLSRARALALLQRGDTAAARDALRDQPENAESLRLLRAAIELADGKPAAADRWLAPLLAAKAEEPRALALGSEAAYAQGDSERARELAERGLRAHPSRLLFERRGLALELAGDLAAARADLERAVALDSRPASPLLHLGRVLQRQGELSAAVLAFQGAAQRNPSDAEAWLSSGLCRAQLGDRAGARVELERAEALAPTRAEPLIALGDLDAAEGDLANAQRRFRAATQLRPELALGWLKLGNGQMRAGRAHDAIASYRRAIDRDASLAAAHNGLGAALDAEGDAQAAVQALELAARLDPRDPNPLYNLARVHRRSGDAQRAELALHRAHEIGAVHED